MKRLLLFKIIIAVFLLNSCSKSSDAPGNSGNTGTDTSFKVKTVTSELIVNGSSQYKIISTLSYDAQDRIIEAKSDSGRAVYTYQTNLIKKDIYPVGSGEQHYIYYLNGMSRVDSLVISSADITSHRYYFYNSENQLEQIRIISFNNFGYSSKDTIAFEYDGYGDISKTIQGENVNAYDYYDKPNFHNSALALDFGFPVNARLLKSSSFAYRGIHQSNTSNSYVFDDYSRIESFTVTENSIGGYSSIYKVTYTYY